MSFDKPTRNALARMVARIRERLAEDITAQLQTDFRLQPDGTTLPLDGLTEDQRAAAEDLRQLLDHFAATLPQAPQPAGGFAAAYERLVREIGFTVLNRLAALRLCEERGLVVECVRKGMASDGFLLFDRLTGGALGPRYATYRAFLENLFDELALDLGVLFDGHSPLSHVFPTERALEDVLALLNDPALAHLWREDETIGWIYQYYNDEAERKKMREESQAPRNTRELAVRNQFFTPRYVVEFLTDNTLGRLWYEMRRGETALAEKCRYLVRRKHPIFLQPGEEPPECFSPSALNMGDPDLPGEMWMRPNPAIEDISSIFHYALTVGGYDYAREHWGVECADLANERSHRYGESGKWEGTFEELRCCLFFEQRRYHHFGEGPEGEDEVAIKELYEAICQRWALEVETVPHRQKKDPREIKMLDPAGGSGHFGLYCFDLFETIYAEAYDDPDLGTSLRADYPDRATFVRDVPRLILAHNLHVIDIDPRACQIAALALWLRAQRSWQAMGLKPGERPRIRKANVVCAEPMPGERDLQEEFVAALDSPELSELVRFVFERMQLAGEAGSLLKIEEELREKIEALKAKAGPLFAQDDFWANAEIAVLQALKEYAEHTANGGAARRQLFADDAAQGFAFIDLCRQCYDVILMNPPFGKGAKNADGYIRSSYPDNWKDLYAAFFERDLSLLDEEGFIGAITSSLFLYTKQLRDFRRDLVTKKILTFLVELGSSVLDSATVDTALSILCKRPQSLTYFIDLTDYEEKDNVLLEAVDGGSCAFSIQILDRFKNIYNWPLCYHVSDEKIALWNTQSRLEPDLATVVAGNHTFDDERFLRLRYEVPANTIGQKWFGYEKGGEYQPFYAPSRLVFKWECNGAEAREHQKYHYGTDAQTIQSISWWFQSGLTYPRVSSVGFGPRVLPRGFIFSEKGMCIFPKSPDDALPLLAVLSCSWAEDLLNAFGRHRAYENSAVANLPLSQAMIDRGRSTLHDLGSRGVQVILKLEQTIEATPVFVRPDFGLISKSPDNAGRDALKLLFERMDNVVGELLFGNAQPALVSERRSSLIDTFMPPVEVHSKDSASDCLSYLIGCAFGRWDIRIALDSTLAPKLQDPFDPLPVCPPGMLIGPDGLPATPGHIVSEEWLRARPNAITLPPEGAVRQPTIADSEYPLHIAWDGILVDDPGLDDRAEHPHPSDIVRRVRKVLVVLWGERAEAIEAEACEILGVASLRDYLRRPSGFFADHLKRYSRSRRQAPIYWPLSTASGRYTVWLYYHRLTQDTLYTVVNQYVTPKLDEVQKRIDLLAGRSDLAGLGRPARSAAELRDQLNDLKGFQSELADFRAELLRVAALPYKPDLNDGVIINAAPLHRLFRLRKWTNDTAAVWKKLEAGEYDWAHLAYTLWPERVKQVCETDRSIAIAHGLEHLCKVEVKQAKRKGRKKAESETETMGIGSEDE